MLLIEQLEKDRVRLRGAAGELICNEQQARFLLELRRRFLFGPEADQAPRDSELPE